MGSRFVDRFAVILLDMGRTFMFNVDRFSDHEDYGATYRRIGGNELDNGEVHQVISALFDRMLSDARNPDLYDHLGSVLSYLKIIPESKGLNENEITLLEQVFAMHEVGTVPDTHVAVLYQLHKTHRLGLVSNIWSRSDLYLREFERAGIRDLFDIIVFSSDHCCIKPSPYLFSKAMEEFEVDHSKILFVGDSLKRDIAGAQAVGLSTAWINAGGAQDVNQAGVRPDLEIQDLRDLLDV